LPTFPLFGTPLDGAANNLRRAVPLSPRRVDIHAGEV
jgi:hypothetical protein